MKLIAFTEPLSDLDRAPWWTHVDELHALVAYLRDHDQLDADDPVSTVLELLETPWSWEDERAARVLERAGPLLTPVWDLSDLEVDGGEEPPGARPATIVEIARTAASYGLSATLRDARGVEVGRVDGNGMFRRSA